MDGELSLSHLCFFFPRWLTYSVVLLQLICSGVETPQETHFCLRFVDMEEVDRRGHSFPLDRRALSSQKTGNKSSPATMGKTGFQVGIYLAVSAKKLIVSVCVCVCV